MSNAKISPNLTWSDDELDLIAAELQRQNPSRQVDTYYRFEFTTMEVEDAAEAVLPQERHRAVASFDDIRRPLYNACLRVKLGPKGRNRMLSVQPPADERIHWKPSEWEEVIEELLRMRPELPETEFQSLQMGTVNAAMLVLPTPRRRHFKQLVGFRPQCYKMWQQIQADKKDIIPPVVVEFKSGPIVEPEVTKKDALRPLATAMHKAFQSAPVQQEEKRTKGTRIQWSNAEWREIAVEMCRANPHFDLAHCTFAVIDLEAIREAQRVLPLQRRRKFYNKLGLQEPLVKAFKALFDERSHNEVYEEPAAKVDAEITKTAYDAFIPGNESKPVEFLKTVQEQHITVTVEQIPEIAQPAPAMAMSSDFLTRLSAAAMPMMGVIVAELAKQLAPEVVKLMGAQMSDIVSEKVIAAMFNMTKPVMPISTVQFAAPAQVEQARPTKSQLAALIEQPAPKLKKPKIAVLGPLGSQKHELELAYPELDIIFIEGGHGIKEACRNSEFLIASNKHAPTNIRNQIKKFSKPDCMRYVDGSISSFKHQIDIWKASKA